MYIRRFLEDGIRRYLGTREIIGVVGPRQSGKTTLLRRIFSGLKNAAFLDFEDRETLELFNEDIKSFIDLHVKNNRYVFIDEFQYAREGGRNLKYIYDTKKVKMFISGSSVSELSIQSIRHLVGRIFTFTLYPLSFEEFINYKEPELYRKVYHEKTLSKPVIERILPYFSEFCVFGGYPRVVTSKDSGEKKTTLKNIYNTYFLKEIRDILGIRDDYKLSRLVHALALQAGNMINYSELSGITGFKYKELLGHLNILEKTFVCVRNRPFYTNKRTELVKVPKIFFVDNGFRNAVIKNFQPPKSRQDKGSLYENFVASELIKGEADIRYWRSKSKAEVDFVIEKNGDIIPMEVKSDLNAPKITRSLRSFMDNYKSKGAFVFSERLWSERHNVSFRPIFSTARSLKIPDSLH